MSKQQPPATDPDRTIVPAPAAATAPAFAGNALAPGTRLHEFEITKVIGEGGFGIVYLAFDHSLQRQVAIKEYMPASLASRTRALEVSVRSKRHAETFAAGMKSFINEARLLAQFDHPSLLKVYRFWEGHGTACMAMPYYEGTTLKDVLTALGRPADEAFLTRLLDDLLDTLRLIHGAQCYHRDIAPDNILMLPNGRPLLLDFGAARRVIGDMTSTLTAILKPGYAPVEQYGEVAGIKQGAWTDLYALGAVAYYAIVGRTPQQSLPRFLNDKLEPLARTHAGQYSERFLSALDAALRVHPRERPQSAVQMRALLGLDVAPLAGAGIDKRAAALERPAARLRRAPAAAIVLSSAGLVIAAAAGVYFYGGSMTSHVASEVEPVAATTAPQLSAPHAAPQAAPVVPALAAPPQAAPLVLAPVVPQAVPAVPAPAASEAAPGVPAPAPLNEAPATERTALPAPAPSPSAESPAIIAAPIEREELPAPTTPARREPRAERKLAAPPARTSPAAVETARRVHRTTDAPERCRDIIARASLGEALQTEETTFLKQECGR